MVKKEMSGLRLVCLYATNLVLSRIWQSGYTQGPHPVGGYVGFSYGPDLLSTSGSQTFV